MRLLFCAATLLCVLLCSAREVIRTKADAIAFLNDKSIREVGTMPATVQGVVRDVFRDDVDDNCVFTILDCDGIIIYATTATTNAAQTVRDYRSLVGCTVSAAGRCYTASAVTGCRPLTRRQLGLAASGLTVLSRPSASPFDAPEITERFPPLHEIATLGPRKARGTVTARWQDDKMLVRIPTGDSVKVSLIDPVLPELGSSVEAVGYPETDLYRINLVRAQWRPAGPAAALPDEPRPVTLENLFFEERSIIRTSVHGNLLRTRGVAKGIVADAAGNRRLLVEDRGFTILVDCSANPAIHDRVREGCEVEVTGVCVLESENWSPNIVIPKVSGLFLVPRTDADVRILRNPPWWTPTRTAWALGLMLALIVAILIWNASLRILVERRSREVIRAQERKLESDLRVGERTRLAAELHDYLAQNLTAVAYRVSEAMASLPERDDVAAGCLQTVSRMLKSCRTDLRRCLWDLRSDVLDEPDFAEAIRRTVRPVAGNARVAVRFEGRRAQLSDSTAHVLLSVLRELTANAANHGEARSIRIAGECRPEGVRFSVQDDGIGFDPNGVLGQDEGHFGLDGIRERLERLGGTLTIDSTPGQGAYIRLTVGPVTTKVKST